jgi:hypothetical protein
MGRAPSVTPASGLDTQSQSDRDSTTGDPHRHAPHRTARVLLLRASPAYPPAGVYLVSSLQSCAHARRPATQTLTLPCACTAAGTARGW